MHWKIITIGKPSFSWAQEAADQYLRRLQQTGRVEWVMLKDGTPEQVTTRMLNASTGCLRVVLDERGQLWRSVELAGWIGQKSLEGRKCAALLVGGANGHPSAVREAADLVWSLSPLTLQHELALVVALEQLYRAGTIHRGEPYHREG
jgi:23S rRNA (pseudouridine1915-N3)-methyltransferase